MNRSEHILTTLGEEGSEVAHRVSKALRFGLTEVQPHQPLTNAERIRDEFYDVIGTYIFAAEEGLVPPFDLTFENIMKVARDKKARIERYMLIAIEAGALS